MANEELNLFEDKSITSNQTASNKPELTGTIAAVFFASSDSFYKVMLVDVQSNNFGWDDSQIVVVGDFADTNEEQQYTFTGQLVDHPKYGTQLKVDQYSKTRPSTKQGLIAYFSGSSFKGVGEKAATKIVEQLGLDAIRKIGTDDHALDHIDISQKQKESLYEAIQQSDGMENIVIGLSTYGFGSSLAAKIFHKYHEESLTIVEEHPYQLVSDIAGIGFKRADQIAQQTGIKLDAPERIQAAIITAVSEWSNNTGDTYISAIELIRQSEQLLNTGSLKITPEQIAEQVVEVAKSGNIVGEEDRIYLKKLYYAELDIGRQIEFLINNSTSDDVSDIKISKTIDKVEKQLGVEYDDTQRTALTKAIVEPMTIITGGPGTGKTTIVNGLINLYAKINDISLDPDEYTDQKYPIMLAAPTGRAAKRLNEVTNVPAKTIHRLLGLNGQDDPDENDVATDISGGLLVVDEMSMVDTELFKLLIMAVPLDMQVVFVGDKDQLPSVGPGQVFHDLISSKKIPTITLDQIHRQKAGSTISDLAYSIQKGKLPDDLEKNQQDRSFFKASAYQVQPLIGQVVQKALDRGFDKNDIQILVPMYRGVAGVDELNRYLQKIMNPVDLSKDKTVTVKNQTFMKGDKVLQLVNSPENNVFNGDIGEISAVVLKDKNHTQPHIIVEFDDNEVTYSQNEWNQLTLAYCISIHKAQGSEFKMVIMPIVHQYARMLQRNLVYTGVTRAESFLILLGERSAFQTAVDHESSNRNTGLLRRLGVEEEYKEHSENKQVSEIIEKEPEEVPSGPLTIDQVNTGSVDPMIGMDGITPKDFMK
ncbi:SF1B family DNA helicase RecD2 [Pediococcus argentinicus]|uniref:ATP-dependent RecD2 DNA helicase n=1 Tax=Pediococcus argentinicus TaxID=480391 RepID=A0A0R2NLQ6_9LACO|nr:ATP-dependent RecD-like DNA helicase [Pediococcus argentinicus]KRO25579.1 hypothetical protein IV88_GL001659 [Pediococcus argentinicus]NKZ22105.1 ATP-dependent RecD-like DNA helicase [Pediococcus argentinicus]GEP20095.1 ATP-dependent RecD-like DNA helicase [Pediococcus argentinicus]